MTAGLLRDRLRCGRPGCDCARPRGNVHCPAHDDRAPSLSVREGHDGRVLLHCFAGCSPGDVLRVLGLDTRDLGRPQHSAGRADRSGVARTTRYEIRTVDGELEAVHVRHHRADGSKSMYWERPDGSPGLNGLAVASLPLYGVEGLRDAPGGEPVIVVEGEKAADALRERGLLAVGTVTGANVTPGEEVLRPLLGRRVVLWPDNDDPGRDHMNRVGARLLALGHADVRVIEWPEAPPAGDAADFPGSDEELGSLQDAAEPWSPAASPTVGVLLSEVQPECVEWLWEGRIPLGKVTLVDGDPGLGKSTLTLDLAARVSTGRAMPDGSPGTCGGVVILTAEDGLADTVRPRLDAAGADVSRVVAIPAVGAGERERVPVLPDDLADVEAAIRRVGAKLVVVDPLMAYLNGNVNSHRDQDVRRALAPLARLADRLRVAVLVVRHLTKGGSSKAIYRGGGSIGIAGAARSVLLVAEDPDDPAVRILAPVKANLAAPGPSLRYRLVEAQNSAVALEWCGHSPHTAEALLATATAGEEEAGALADAKHFLADVLADGALPAKGVQAQARSAGISEPTLRRARVALGVRAKPVREDGERRIKAWYWSLPDSLGDQGDQPLADDHLERPGAGSEARIGNSLGDHGQGDQASMITYRASGNGAAPTTGAVGVREDRDPGGTASVPCSGGCGSRTSEPVGMCERCQAREARFHGLGKIIISRG